MHSISQNVHNHKPFCKNLTTRTEKYARARPPWLFEEIGAQKATLALRAAGEHARFKGGVQIKKTVFYFRENCAKLVWDLNMNFYLLMWI